MTNWLPGDHPLNGSNPPLRPLSIYADADYESVDYRPASGASPEVASSSSAGRMAGTRSWVVPWLNIPEREDAAEAWSPDLTPSEIDRLADALRRADYMNWSAQDVAAKIAGTVAVIADARIERKP